MDAEQLLFVHVHTVQKALERLFEDEALRQAADAFRQTIDYGGFLKHLKMEPHLIELLDWLRGKFKTAIATNRTAIIDELTKKYGEPKGKIIRAYGDLADTWVTYISEGWDL